MLAARVGSTSTRCTAFRVAYERSTVLAAVVEKHPGIVLRSLEEALAFVARERGAKAAKTDAKG